MRRLQGIDSKTIDLVKQSRIIVTLGSGGVGKTTTSVALAVIGAMLGKKVGLLSIDPAKRLAEAMGISLGNQLTEVKFSSELAMPGQVFGAMLDQKAVFDEMVEKWTDSANVKEKIYANSIYQAVSQNLGGPLEYMALAKLQSMAEDSTFDLIVLDTPPDSHALDFLDRPNALSGFMERGVMTWLIKPFHFAQKLGAGKLFRAGGRMMSGIASVTGVKMLQMLAEFLILMEDVIKGFNKIGSEVSQLLKQENTNFILVTAPHPAAVRSVQLLLKELKEKDYPLGGLYINRCIPQDLSASIDRCLMKVAPDSIFSSGFSILKRKKDSSQEMIERTKQLVDESNIGSIPIIRVEEQDKLIHSLDILVDFATNLALTRTDWKGA